MADIQGTCDSRFAGVQEALANSLDAGTDVGASVAVFVEGQPVVDIWGGFVDERAQSRGQRDTITNVWSTTKTMTFLCALMLADRGELDFHAPVARYWPEFAAGGKEAVEVRHLMAHIGRALGVDRPPRARRPGRLGEVHVPAGRPGAVVGAGHRIGVPRA